MQSSRGAPHVCFKISAYIILSSANLHGQQCSWDEKVARVAFATEGPFWDEIKHGSHMSSAQLTRLFPENWGFYYPFAWDL